VPQDLPSKISKKKVLFLVEMVTQVPNYPWNKSSCRLDTSLQLLYVTIQKVPGEFTHISEALHKNSALWEVLVMLLECHTLDPQGENMSVILCGQQDDIHKLLKKKKAIKNVTQFESLFICTTPPLHSFLDTYIYG
jgi:hypothetical protein